MSQVNHYLTKKQKRKIRTSSKIYGTAQRPRLSIYRSNRYVQLQVIDDDKQKTIVASCNYGKNKKFKGNKTETAIQAAELLLKELKKKKIKKLVVDRGSYKYHGRIKKVVETLRKGGINI